MGTCSIATSARRAYNIRRRLFCGVDADATTRHQLGTQPRDLELDWDAYKARPPPPQPLGHRHAVTAVGPGDDLSYFLRCSPRRLVYPLQQDGSGTDSVVSDKGGNGGQVRGNEEDASSVCSVKVEHSMTSPSSCSCPHHCAALGRSSSTSTVSSDSSSSPAGGGVVVTEHATTRAEEERGVTGNNRVKWFAAIAFVVVMGVIVAMVVMELGVDEEFLVPT